MESVVPAASGDLRAEVHAPYDDPVSAGVVLVDGSGDGACEDWGEWPARVVGCGAVVLTHDKPGCGASPGDWTTQSFDDRARESAAAARVLREHPLLKERPVGLMGFSQGGWVSLLAAVVAQPDIDFVVSLCGPGVSPAEQERYRIRKRLEQSLPPADVTDGLAWIETRNARLLAGDPVSDILAAQQQLADRAWYAAATEHFDSAETLRFLAGILDFDPVPVLRNVRCPVLALFGADDMLVPVADSVTAFVANLPSLPGSPHGIAVFPGADHGLFTADPKPQVNRTDQLAGGLLPMLAAFLQRQARRRSRAG